MDYLPYDLVAHIIHLLPTQDVKTIVKATSESRKLETWNRAAEYFLDGRYYLDVEISVPNAHAHLSEDQVRFSVTKCSMEGQTEPWDFKNWRDAWIRSIVIHSNCSRRRHRRPNIGGSVDLTKALRVCSLPVAPGCSSLKLADVHELKVGITSKILDVVQKTFSVVSISCCESGVDEFLSDYLEKEALLEDLSINCTRVADETLECVATLLSKRRKKPLKINFGYSTRFTTKSVDCFVRKWMSGSGEYGGGTKTLTVFLESVEQLEQQYNFVHSFGFLAHPSKRSSLKLHCEDWRGKLYIDVVKFEAEHCPMDLEDVNAFIRRWKRTDGFRVHKMNADASFTLKDQNVWRKLAERYGPAQIEQICLDHRSSFDSLKTALKAEPEMSICQLKRDSQSQCTPCVTNPSFCETLSIVHPKGVSTLKLGMKDISVVAVVQRNCLDEDTLNNLIFDWKNGNGVYVSSGLSIIEVDVPYLLMRQLCNGSHRFTMRHPSGNCRLRFQGAEYCPWTRISVIGIEPEAVRDWNLDILFGQVDG